MDAVKRDIIPPQVAVTLDGLFRERVRRTPDRPAYHSCDRSSSTWTTVTWIEVAREVARWQAALEAERLRPGDRVAVALRNAREWVYLDQSALALGLVVVPLYVEDRADNIAYILQDCGARLLLVPDPAYWRRLAPLLNEAPSLDRILVANVKAGRMDDARVRLVEEWLGDVPPKPPARLPDPHALASIVYTSGTTGRPKGVMLSHHNMLSIAYGALAMADCYPNDVFLSFLPLSHTLERTGGYYLPMMAGSSVAFARSVMQLAEDLRAVRPTMMIAVPRIFERFYDRIRQQLSRQSPAARRLFDLTTRVGWRQFEYSRRRASWSPALLLWPLLRRLVADRIIGKLGGRLRLAVSGGAPLGAPVARTFLSLGLPLLQGYGLTETSPVISVNPPDDNDPASVGVPLPGVQVRIGRDSELLVKTPGAMLGYWNNPEATAEMFDEEGWLRTGDQARIEDGHIHITGRIKDILVLSNGEKVPPGDMEGAIALDGLFDQVMVMGEGHPFLSAILVLNPDQWPDTAREHGLDSDDSASLEDARLAAAMVARVGSLLKDFPSYAKVRRVVLSLEPWTVDNGLLTPTLKVKRRKVLERYQEAIGRVYAEGPTGSRRKVA